jgi:hypothetical protein
MSQSFFIYVKKKATSLLSKIGEIPPSLSLSLSKYDHE